MFGSGQALLESRTLNFFKKYFDVLASKTRDIDIDSLERLAEMLVNTQNSGKKVIIAGNGGSAAIASHISVDLTNAAGIRSVSFNEADLITCFANDFGYELWLSKALEAYADSGDTAILISSSGKSPNITNAAIKARQMNLNVITLSGFDINNPLKKMGDINLWIDSSVYNVVETIHNIWLASIVDLILDQKVNNNENSARMPIVTVPSKTTAQTGKNSVLGK